MRLTIAAIIATVAFASAAWANCRYHTYTDSRGNFVSCSTCCFGGSCNTVCN